MGVLSHTPLFIIGAVAFTVTVTWIAYGRQRDAGEPFAFFEGISVWPTEGIRLFAGLLCVHFLAKAYYGLRRNDHETRQAFMMNVPYLNAREVAEENRRSTGLQTSDLPNVSAAHNGNWHPAGGGHGVRVGHAAGNGQAQQGNSLPTDTLSRGWSRPQPGPRNGFVSSTPVPTPLPKRVNRKVLP